MPCIGGPIGSCIDESEVMALRDKLQKSIHERDILTRMLCELITKIKETGGRDQYDDHEVWDDYKTPELSDWWDKHQTWDQKRKQMERDVKILGEFMGASSALKQITQDLATIKKLGGMPTPKMTMKLANAQEQYDLAEAAMKSSKPSKNKKQKPVKK